MNTVQAASASVSAVCCTCTRTIVRTSTAVYAGDIAAVVGLKNTRTGDTLCDDKHPIVLESMEFPEPVIRVAIEPKTKAGQEKMAIALSQAEPRRTPPSRPIPTRRPARPSSPAWASSISRLSWIGCSASSRSRQTSASRRFLTRRPSREHRYGRHALCASVRRQGPVCAGQDPDRAERRARAIEFINAVTGGAIPKEYIPSVDQGIQGAMASGVLAGYPGRRREGHPSRRQLP